jgi:transcriptional regulator with XRE-family HTH domain
MEIETVHTISAPAEAWRDHPPKPNQRYQTRLGRRVLGWEDTNISLLATDVGVSFHYLLAVLRGERNCTLALLQRTALALGIELTELITRMEKSYRLNLEAAAKGPSAKDELKKQQRQRREQRRVLSLRD